MESKPLKIANMLSICPPYCFKQVDAHMNAFKTAENELIGYDL